MAVDDDLIMRSATDIAAAIVAREATSEAVTAAYLDRIEAVDRAGPRLQSVLAVNPTALDDARALDVELAQSGPRGPLHGVPVLVKDNIETADPLPTTAGALALAGNVSGRDAMLVAGLRAAGALILGKTNLSEWANFRSTSSISGWSALGGQVRNPHILDRSPCGSSSGSGAATAAFLAAATVGTETNGSIICPSAVNGVVGFKPTVGLVSQAGIVPIAPSQDTAGPMTRTVADAALLLSAMATGGSGFDPAAVQWEGFLSGRRLGVLRFATGTNAGLNAAFGSALGDLEAAGASLVEIEDFEGGDDLEDAPRTVLEFEFKAALNAYLATSAPDVTTRTLADVIAFNSSSDGLRELALFDQDIFEQAEARGETDDPAYLEARTRVMLAAGRDGIDRLIAEYGVDLLVAPSASPAAPIDAINGDSRSGVGAGWMAAIAGYPHVTVPMGAIHGAPVGLSFLGPRDADADVLAAGHAYEARTHHRQAPTFLATAESVAAVQSALTRPE